jgi:hypothetical protein
MLGNNKRLLTTGLAVVLGSSIVVGPILTACAQTPKKTASSKRAAAKRKSPAASGRSGRKSRTVSDAERRAKAMKAYDDYQYVKLLGPISGQMYKSTKW